MMRKQHKASSFKINTDDEVNMEQEPQFAPTGQLNNFQTNVDWHSNYDSEIFKAQQNVRNIAS
jgi:hypothetical protein